MSLQYSLVKYYILLFLVLSLTYVNAQKKDSSKLLHIRPYITPSTLIGGGLFLNFTSHPKLNKTYLQQQILTKYPDINTNLDDFLPFVPIGQMYLGNALGLNSKNGFVNKSKYLFFSQLFTSIITHTLKRTTQIMRPDGTPHAFPSGHTSFAFSSASTLFYEYKSNHPIYASSGFIFATGTGALRVLNNRHWVSDVLVGAGIGILVTHLVYHFEPLKNWNPLKRKKTKARLVD